MITNIDIFTVIHDDPYIMGKIAACNVTNDLFALNANEILNYSNFMGLPSDFPDEYAIEALRGTKDFLNDLGSNIHGGHTIFNPWPQFGGSTSAILNKEHIIRKTGIKLGDQLIITKPIGVQPIMAGYRVLHKDKSWFDDFDISSIQKSIDFATDLMTTSNQNVTEVIHENDFTSIVHAMTDITGFGICGHLIEMMADSNLGATIKKFPTITNSIQLADIFGYKLKEGYSPEISGGMLMSVKQSDCDNFTEKLSSAKVWWKNIGSISNKFSGIKFDENFILENIEGY